MRRRLRRAVSVSAVALAVAYVLAAYSHTDEARLRERNPFAGRAPRPGCIPPHWFKTGPLPADAPSVRPLLADAQARAKGIATVVYLRDNESRAFVSARCGPRVLAAYDLLVPGSFRADLFRYCALWSEGGVYSDLSQRLRVPLQSLVDFERDHLVLVRDRAKPLTHPGVTPIQIAFMAATPRHWVLRIALDTAVEHVHARYYGRTPLDITGPFMLGRLLSPGGAAYNAEYRLELEEAPWGGELVSIGSRLPVIDTKAGGHAAALSRLGGAPRYDGLWWWGRVYNQPAMIREQPPSSFPRVALFLSSLGNRSAIASARLSHLRRTLPPELLAAGVGLHVLPAVTHGSKHQRQYHHLRNLLVEVHRRRHELELALVADDDMDVAPAFLSELMRDVDLLPDGWRLLHLCPGFLWGRSNTASRVFRPLAVALGLWPWGAGLEPEAKFPKSKAKFGQYDRVLLNMAELARAHADRLLLGGPIAFALRPAQAQAVLAAYDAAYARLDAPSNALILTNMSTTNDYVAYRPVLCAEVEQG